MPQIGVLNSFTNGTVVDAGPHNANWTDVKSAFNTSAVLTDVAKTVAVTHTWTASQTFTGGATFGAAISGTTASFTGALSGLIAAASITSGNIDSARLAGAYSGITGVGTLLSLAVSGAVTLSSTLAVGSNGDLTGLTVTNATQSAAVRLNTANANAGARNWGFFTNADAFGDLILKVGAAQGTDSLTGTKVIGISSGGAVTLSSTLAVSGHTTLSAGADLRLANTSWIKYLNSTGAAYHDILQYDNTNQTILSSEGDVALRSGVTTRLLVKSTGQVLIGTTVTTGTAAGDVILANAKALRGVNAAGTSTRALVSYNSDDYLVLGDAGTHIAIGLFAAASLPAGAANRNGIIDIDTTNNRFIYYSGGNRYYLTGTAF